MDILQDFVEDNIASQKNILKFVDEYSIYSYYIGQEIEVGVKYSSPFRIGDEDPSFALYISRNDGALMFKDHGTGLSGGVFVFVKTLLNLSLRETCLQINSDFSIGLDGKDMGEFKAVLIKKKFLIKEPVSIRITSQLPTKKFKDYWNSLDISQQTLDIFYARDTAIIHYITKSTHKTVIPKTLCISYEIPGYYKIYQPFEVKFRFTNNYPTGYVEGGMQLRWNLPFVIITKSTKECMFFREHFNWDACAGTSENSHISDYFMQKLFASYPLVFIWLDNDAPGKRAQAVYLEKYPTLIPIEINTSLSAKDPTDLYLLYKQKNEELKALEYLRKLILIHLSNGE